MNVTKIVKTSWLLTNLSKDTYKKDINDFMKSLNCACHVEDYGWMATTPITFRCLIKEDI